MFLINTLVKVLKAINANQRPGEIGAAIAIAWLLALIPAGRGLWWALFLFSLFLRIHFAMQAVFLALFNLFIFLLDPLLHSIGHFLLTHPALRDFWLALWNTPPLPLLGFQNTLVTGGFVFGVLTWLPIYFLATWLVTQYRDNLHQWVAEHPLVKAFFQIPFVKTIAEAYRKATAVFEAF